MKRNFSSFFLYCVIFASLFLTGCAETNPTDREIYAQGVILHNVTDTTDLTIAPPPSALTTAFFTYDLPGPAPASYDGFWYFISPHDFGAGASILPAAVGITQTVRSFIRNDAPLSYERNFLLYRQTFLAPEPGTSELEYWALKFRNGEGIAVDVFTSYAPLVQSGTTFFFGTGYVPTSAFFEQGRLRLNGPLVQLPPDGYLFVHNNLTTCMRHFDTGVQECLSLLSQEPTYTLHYNGTLLRSGPLGWRQNNDDARRLEHFISSFNGGNYTLEMSIPGPYALFNQTRISASFDSSLTDHSPPVLTGLAVPGRFVPGESLSVFVNATDTDSAVTTRLWYKNESSEWIPVALLVGIDASTTLPTFMSEGSITSHGTSLSLMVVLSDAFGNTQTYTIEPISLATQALVVEYASSVTPLSPGAFATYRGNLSQGGKGAGSLFIQAVYNGEEIAASSTTDDGNFTLSFFIPLSYTPQDNLSFVYGGVGTYASAETVVQGFAQRFTRDGAVIALEMPTPLYLGPTVFNVTLANVGFETVSGPVSIIQHFELYREDTRTWVVLDEWIVGNTSVSVALGEELTVPIPVTSVGTPSYYRNSRIRFSAQWSVAGDEGMNNNRLSRVQEIFKRADVGVSATVEGYKFTNESQIPYRFTLFNRGIDTLRNVTYAVVYASRPLFDEEPVYHSILNGSVGVITRGNEVTISAPFSLPLVGDYEIRVSVNASDDFDQTNNVGFSSVRIMPLGADLSGYLFVEEDAAFIVNETANYTFSIANSGTLPTVNGMVSVYAEQRYCYYPDCTDLSLVTNRSLVLDPDQSLDVSFNFTPSHAGEYTLIVIMNASNEIAPDNNVAYFHGQALESGPNLATYFDYSLYNRKFVVGVQNNISVVVRNLGTEPVTNASLTLSFRQDKETFSLILNQSVGTLLPEETRIINFSFVPSSAGYTIFRVVGMSDRDTTLSNNEDSTYLFMLVPGIDVLFYYFSDYPLYVGIASEFYANLFNAGGTDSGLVSVNLSIDGLVYDTRHLSQVYSDVYHFSPFLPYTPVQPGSAVLEIVASLFDDVNLSNNKLNVTVPVRTLHTVSFRVLNSSFAPVSRFLSVYVPGLQEYNFAFGPLLSNVSVSVPREGAPLSISRSVNYSEGYTSVGYRLLNLSSEQTILSEYYDSLVQGNRTFHAVFVNDVSFNYTSGNQGPSSSVFTALTSAYASQIGMNLSRLYDYSLFYCTEFNFSLRTCTASWTVAPGVSFQKHRGEFYFTSHSIHEAFDAYALSYAPSRFGGTSTRIQDSTLDTVASFTLDVPVHGTVVFQDAITINRFRSEPDVLSQAVTIADHRISVNTSLVPELANKSARLTFRNVDLRNPQILYEGSVCSPPRCANQSSNHSDNSLSVTVTGFSTYEVQSGAFCGDGVCQASIGERCDSCVADCGRCDRGGGGCLPRVFTNCTWLACDQGIQKQRCIDQLCPRYLPYLSNPHEQTRACLTSSPTDGTSLPACSDNDRDGYGVGSACLGQDSNDNDPAVNSVDQPPADVPLFDRLRVTYPWLLPTLIGGIIILSVLIVVVIILMGRPRSEIKSS